MVVQIILDVDIYRILIKEKNENMYYIIVSDGKQAYIKKVYYVLMTRGIKGIYLYVCNPELKTYLSQFIDVIGE